MRTSFISTTNSRMGNVTMRARKEAAITGPAVRPKMSQASSVAPPETPGPDARAVKAQMELLGETIKSVKNSASPIKSPSPCKRFLTKDSNLTNYAAWDVDGRLQEVETQFKGLQEIVNSSFSDKKAMEDAIELAKTRGKATKARAGLG